MPLIDVSILEGRLTPDTEEQLLARLTDAVAEVFGDDIRAHTWVVLRPVPPTRWGIAGRDCS